ncbi:hypothetical protein ABW19_dt0205613 [Dactylella cylindrospora]|nr:hypothetical protein ABW19_dt0205613 [Dactylella cylindrospora]
MLSKIKEAGRRVTRSNSTTSNDSILENSDATSYNTDSIIISENNNNNNYPTPALLRRYSISFTHSTHQLQHHLQQEQHKRNSKMDRRPPLRKRGSSLFNKMTAQETYDSIVPRSTSSSRLSERTITPDNRDSHFASLSTRIKTHRMRKTSQLSLSLGPLDEHEIRQPSQRRGSPHLHRIHSVPDLLSRSQVSPGEPRAFCNGKPISNPFNFRHVSHMENQQTVQLESTADSALPDQWNTMVRESRAPKTPIVPLTPLSPRGVRHMQSLSGSLRTSGLPIQSPSTESVYSPVDSMANLSMKSKSAESLNGSFPSRLAPPPRGSSRGAFTQSKDEDLPILESEGRDSVIFLQDEIPSGLLSPKRQSRGVGPILEEEPGLLDREVEDDVLGAFPTPPVQTRPALRSFKSQPDIAINNQLLMPPASPPRPTSSSSDTLGLGISGGVVPQEKSINKRLSKRMSKRLSRRISILAEAEAEIQSWEADIDWTYDNNGLDEWVDDLDGIEEEEEEESIEALLCGSKSAPVSASPSAVNLASLSAAHASINRYSDGSGPLLSATDDTPAPRSPGIGIADGGFGIFDHADHEYNAYGHQRQLSKTRNVANQRTLSTCASLPNLKANRKHYRNSSLRGVSNLDNGVVSLNEADEFPNPAFQRTHSAPREVAIPPARYSGRSRAASNATCTTLVSDVEGFSSDISEMASTPSHSSHNSAEGPYFLPQTQDGLFIDTKGQLTPGVQIVNDEAQFNFF